LAGTVLVMAGCGSEPAYLQEDSSSYLDNSAQQNQEVKSDVSEIRSALLAYSQTQGSFPPELTSLVPNYLPELPVSPITGEVYEYRGDLLGGDYELTYQLADGKEYTANKNTTDLQLKKELDKPEL